VSTGDYPAEWEADVVLTDGGTVHVRPVCPADAERLVAFHGRLSHQSIYYRFFSPRPRLSQDDVTRFTTVDYDDRMALVALLGDDLVGIASYDRWPGRREAEVAFTVDDEHQGRVATVASTPRGHRSITRPPRFTGSFENRRCCRSSSAGFQAKSQFADGVVAVEMDIDRTDVALERAPKARGRGAFDRGCSPLARSIISAGERRGTVGHEVLRRLSFVGSPRCIRCTDAHRGMAWPRCSTYPATSMPVMRLQVGWSRWSSNVREAIASRGAPQALPRSTKHARDGPRSCSRAPPRHAVLRPTGMGIIRTVRVSMRRSPVTLIPGRVAFSGQSGPLGVALLEQAHRAGVGISHFVALGNKADVSTNDFLQYWEGDESTSVMALHIASFGNPRKFTRLARRVSKTKPIVAVKTGGGDEDRTADALFRQTGVIPVGEIAELSTWPRARQPAAATGRSRRGDQRLRGEIARGAALTARSAHG
jgi:hypothetical protein